MRGDGTKLDLDHIVNAKTRSQVRRRENGFWETGVTVAGLSWVWADLPAKRKDVAARLAPDAHARLMEKQAAQIEEAAYKLVGKANRLREEAKNVRLYGMKWQNEQEGT